MITINENLLIAKFDAKMQELNSLSSALSQEDSPAIFNCKMLNEQFLGDKLEMQVNNHLQGLANTINKSLFAKTDQGNALYEKLCEAQCLANQIYFSLYR